MEICGIEEAIQNLKYSTYSCLPFGSAMANKESIETVLNELEKKDKVINEMAKEIADITGSCPYDKYDYDLDCDNKCKHDIEKECWIKYFTNKAENVGE